MLNTGWPVYNPNVFKFKLNQLTSHHVCVGLIGNVNNCHPNFDLFSPPFFLVSQLQWWKIYFLFSLGLVGMFGRKNHFWLFALFPSFFSPFFAWIILYFLIQFVKRWEIWRAAFGLIIFSLFSSLLFVTDFFFYCTRFLYLCICLCYLYGIVILLFLHRTLIINFLAW